MKEYVIELFVKNDKRTYLYRTVNVYDVGMELKVLDSNCKISCAIIVNNNMRVSGVGLPYLEEIVIKNKSFVFWRVDFSIINCDECTYTFKSRDEALEFIKYMQDKYPVGSTCLYEDVI